MSSVKGSSNDHSIHQLPLTTMGGHGILKPARTRVPGHTLRIVQRVPGEYTPVRHFAASIAVEFLLEKDARVGVHEPHRACRFKAE
jgi:hypothetical protein